MGLIPDNSDLYNYLQSIGYDISFKPTVTSKEAQNERQHRRGTYLKHRKRFYENELESVVLVAGDGDYHCIVEFLKEKRCPSVSYLQTKISISFIKKGPMCQLLYWINLLRNYVKTKKPPDMP